MRGSTLSRWHWSVPLLVVANASLVSAKDLLFQQFFPGWDGLMRYYLQQNCSMELAEYNVDPMDGRKWSLVDCLADGFTETRKLEAAAAGITLGLAPTVIQNIGPSTSETSLLFTRRPLLALLLAISSPWPRNPDDTIFTTTGDPPIPVEVFAGFLSWSEPMLLVVEYAMALGAAANVALLAYQLGHLTFFTLASNVNDPVWWTYCSFLIHLIGILGIFTRFKLQESNGWNDESKKKNWFKRWYSREFKSAAYDDKNKKTDEKYNGNNDNTCRCSNKNDNQAGLQLKEREGKLLILLSVLATWVLSIAPTLQVVLGTMMLSTSVFTSPADARNCLIRYVCSAIVGRALLSFELSYLTRSVKPRNPRNSWDSLIRKRN